MPQGKIFIISAPTGGGKTSLTSALLETPGLPLERVITYTTRPPRGNEINSKDYYFISQEDFLQKKKEGFFLETTLYDTYYYGSPRSIIDETRQGRSFVMVTDRPGALHIKTLVPDAVLVWISVPDARIIAQRLKMRGREQSDEALERRISIAKQEIAIENKEHAFDHHINNVDFQEALDELKKIALKELDLESSSTI